ncbi:Sec-independent protein translocase protein TatB [Luteimonas sp. MC1750]|uniref:Sec-independent protein translocase protein TatB n=1 Tax=Luteimonas sp. MC1750 TaxID=2799326 RepID=UPI0018F0CC2D|nr:Sec-independent protein translocase protein TatB [Luteimonas sp. MC1750]MBJ6985178.1 twin-arginine translocase subunit TatB [Luteimonas sp. MC1750]QQO05831.1 twin-arginine translocase subunit TatB [Luteimonas sp. MC1750]
MFDLGFGELLMIALVALVVLGPERLPKAARFAGLWVRRARAQWYSVRSELERELAAEELKRNLDSVRSSATDFERQARSAVDDLDAGVRKADADARKGFRALRDDLAGERAAPDAPTAGEGAGSGTAAVQEPSGTPAGDSTPAADGDADGRG